MSTGWRAAKAALQEVADVASASLHQAAVEEMKHKKEELEENVERLEKIAEEFRDR